MAVSETVTVGCRVRVTGILPNDPAPLAIGDEGVVTMVTNWQIMVLWKSGRTLILLPDDPFEVLP